MGSLLLTGFVPFPGMELNPCQQIVQILWNRKIGDFDVSGIILPLDHRQATEELLAKFSAVQPDIVLSLGLAIGQDRVILEHSAINRIGKEPYNPEATGENEPIIADGPAAYFSTLPNEALLDRLLVESIPAEISSVTGTSLCNQVMYQLLHHISRKHLSVKAGAVHLPASHPMAISMNQHPMPSLSLDSLLYATRFIIETLGK